MGAAARLPSICLLLALLAACSAVPLDKQKEYRLPETVVPASYEISYDSVSFQDFSFRGSVSIAARIVADGTSEIVLHAGALSTVVESVRKGGREVPRSSEPTYQPKPEKLSIALAEALRRGDLVTIRLAFSGTLRDTMSGFYRSSYYDEAGVQRWLAATQFEATSARHAFPCFDEPQLKATFAVRIRPPRGYHCLGNMPHRLDNDICVFDESKPMSSYLLAFVVEPEFRSKSAGRFSAWARPGAVGQAAEAVRVGTAALENLAQLLNEPYSLPKMDMVALPDFAAGAMENWGLMTFRETASLYQEGVSSDADRQRVASVVVHECAHMWFGNLVTPTWWSWLWLSEAFARYFQYMATAQIEPGWRMNEQFVVEQQQLAFGADSLASSPPMTRPAVTQSEIGATGDVISYSKGASIVRMMEKSFGAELFVAALRDYIRARRYGSAEPQHLWRAFQARLDQSSGHNSSVSVATAMKTWTEQPGFPCVTVGVERHRISLSQRRFLLLRHEDTPPDELLWWVPISWLSPRGASQELRWLSKREDSLANEHGDGDWLILNAHSAGFYRVNYDDRSWARIISALDSEQLEKIAAVNRAAIVDDLLNLARAEILDYEIALRGLLYLKRETNYLPFKSALGGLDHLLRKFSAHRDELELLKEFVLSLLKPVYKKISYDDRAGDDHLTVLLRRELNSRVCSLGYSECIAKSQAYFSKWREQGVAVPRNQRLAAYCSAVGEGGEREWRFLWQKYREAGVAAEQQTILSALGCTKDRRRLERYLLLALTSFEESRIRRQDVSAVFSGVYSASREGAEYMLEFVQQHHEAIRKYHNGYDEIESLVAGALAKYPIRALVDRLQDMIGRNESYIESVRASLEKTLRTARLELDWTSKYAPIIANWIKDRLPLENTTAYRLPGNVSPAHYQIHSLNLN